MSAAERIVPLLMQRKRAAEFLGLSTPEFWRMEKRGEIPTGVMLPGQKRGRRWHRDQLVAIADRWMKP